ncbi:MAG: MAPEG family protein [Sphingobium sp.]
MKGEILAPVVALVLWTLVMWFWMYATRIPAMQRLNVRLDPTVPPGTLTAVLPPEVRWKADNYNHLMEQPTIFYATALTLALLGAGDGLNAQIAWAYVGLRVLHSLVQVTVNRIMIRFIVFVLSTIALTMLAIHAALIVF